MHHALCTVFVFRPTEVDLLQGDFTKAREKLGWVPKIKFKDLVARMTANDLTLAEREQQRA
jgi:GDPmannose 4,6-dehydratase